jgi:hypothetical protein
LALSPDKRKTKQQAATFALKAAHGHQFDCRGDRYKEIMGWLFSHIGKIN